MKIVIQPNDFRAETLGSSRLVSILSSTPLNSVQLPSGKPIPSKNRLSNCKMSIIDSTCLTGINEVQKTLTWYGAWHISSIAAAAVAITISFTITGKYQQKKMAKDAYRLFTNTTKDPEF